MSSSGIIRLHPVLTFYVLTFAISWGGILVVVSLGGVPGNPAQLVKMIPVRLAAFHEEISRVVHWHGTSRSAVSGT